MTRDDAVKLYQYHNFTREELYNILAEAYDTYHEDYWKKPNKVNPIFDNGYYFNQCVEWLGYNGKNGKEIVQEIFAVRILEVWGKFSNVHLPKKTSPKVEIVRSEVPILPTFEQQENGEN